MIPQVYRPIEVTQDWRPWANALNVELMRILGRPQEAQGDGGSDLPDGGTNGQVLGIVDGEIIWRDLPTASLGVVAQIQFQGAGNTQIGTLLPAELDSTHAWVLPNASGTIVLDSMLGSLAYVSPIGTPSSSTYLRGDGVWVPLPTVVIPRYEPLCVVQDGVPQLVFNAHGDVIMVQVA